jgi:hypothetical protein
LLPRRPVGVAGRVSERVAGHYMYGVNVAISLASVSGMAQEDFIPCVCIKNLNIALLKMGISLPETC